MAVISNEALTDCKSGAEIFYNFGFAVIPIHPKKKHPSVKWDPWLEELSPEKIHDYWTTNSSMELGFVVGDKVVVFDADTDAAKDFLYKSEQRMGITPSLVVTTKKGEHHFFRVPESTRLRADSHSTEKHPERVDIKTGRSIAVLPPSTNKTIKRCDVESAQDLAPVTQSFVDAVFAHNGRSAPQPRCPRHLLVRDETASEESPTKLHAIIDQLDPDSGYEDWIRVGMALHHATGGSNAGLELFDAWSGGGSSYAGAEDIETHWRSFSGYSDTPVTLGTLCKMLSDAGGSPADTLAQFEEQFEICDTLILRLDGSQSIIRGSDGIEVPLAAAPQITAETNDTNRPAVPLLEYSLRGMHAQLQQQLQDDAFVLDPVALLGQWSVFYAQFNTGKTLLCLWLLIEAIRAGGIDPENVFYINADDTFSGLVQKLALAEEHSFHMIAPGHMSFDAVSFISQLKRMIRADICFGVVIFLDTLKKFTDLMDPKTASRFGKIIRAFISKGGTLIALAHTNKSLGPDGMPQYGGTSDIINDADCAYILHTLEGEGNADTKVVQFKNKKHRGNVALTANFQYSIAEGLNYENLLESVHRSEVTEPAEAQFIEAPEAPPEPLAIINAITACITAGITTKSSLIDAAAIISNARKRQVQLALEALDGPDPAAHRWHHTVGAHNTHSFALNTPPMPALPEPRN